MNSAEINAKEAMQKQAQAQKQQAQTQPLESILGGSLEPGLGRGWTPNTEEKKMLAIGREISQMNDERLHHLQEQIWTLQRQLARYNRVFEQLFKEELDQRLNGNQAKMLDEYGSACEPSGDRLLRAVRSLKGL